MKGVSYLSLSVKTSIKQIKLQILCEMNHKQLGYGQDDSLSYSTFRRFTNLWGILRALFSLESQGKDDLHWISYALRAIGRDQYPGSLLHNVRMRKRVRWFFSQCCLSYATQPHRRTDIIRRNKFDYTLGNQICVELFLELLAQTPPKGIHFFAWNNFLCGTNQYALVAWQILNQFLPAWPVEDHFRWYQDPLQGILLQVELLYPCHWVCLPLVVNFPWYSNTKLYTSWYKTCLGWSHLFVDTTGIVP